MAKFIGVCDSIDWNVLISHLAQQEAAYIGPRHDVGHDVRRGHEDLAEAAMTKDRQTMGTRCVAVL